MKISPKKSTVVHTRATREFTGAHKRPPIKVTEESKVEIPVSIESEQVTSIPEDAVVVSENQVYVGQMAPAEIPTEVYESAVEVYATGEPVVIDMAKEPVPDVVIANGETTVSPETSITKAVEPPFVQEETAIEQAAEIAKEAEQEVVATETVAEDKYHYFYCTKSNGQKVTYKRNVNSKYYAQEVEAFKKTLADKGTTIDSEEVK